MELKSLAKDTAIYGLSSIVGRFLNYLLVPLYTNVIPASTGGYGIVSNVYAFTALMLVFLTFGMETGFFRFANRQDEDPRRVYANALLFVGGLSLLFVIVCLAGLAYLRNGTEPVYLPRIRWNAPSQNPQKSGFSRPVGANEANPVPLLYNKMVNCQEPSVPVFLP